MLVGNARIVLEFGFSFSFATDIGKDNIIIRTDGPGEALSTTSK
jgi:hypothetical protein